MKDQPFVARQIILLLICFLVTGFLEAQETISDGTFLDSDWSVQVVAMHGASEIHQHFPNGGNPDAYRFMEHILPYPPGEDDTSRIEVVHIYEGDAFDPFFDNIATLEFAEDIRLTNQPWPQAQLVSYPAIRQGGKYFRATEGMTVSGNSDWTSLSIGDLAADDFIALDGSGDKPDFLKTADDLYFGFWRMHERTQDYPPVPQNETIFLFHGCDNFMVTIDEVGNTAPEARDDEYLYLEYAEGSNAIFPVLSNDSDPDGDSIWITETNGAIGTIVGFDHETVTYAPPEESAWDDLEADFFTYRITDGDLDDGAFVQVYFCYCPIQCVVLFLAGAPPEPPQHIESGWTKLLSKSPVADSLDIPLFRRFRDEVLLPTEEGADLVDVYYNYASEVIPLLIFDRTDIGLQAYRALQAMEPLIDNLLNGDGTSVITQQLVDSVNVFIDSLMANVSDSLQQDLQASLDSMCPMEGLVGLPVAETVDAIVCDTMSTGTAELLSINDAILKQNYPNPFSTSGRTGSAKTTIPFFLAKPREIRLDLYSIYGQRILTLAEDVYGTGEQHIVWDGRDHIGRQLPPGMYFYQLSIGKLHVTKQLVIVE